MRQAKIVIFGKTGQVAHSLMEAGRDRFELRAFGRETVDPQDSQIVESIVAAERPDLILNAAAFTAVDLAEKEPAAAFALNADLPKAIARAASRHKIPFVHVSSDYVFDGGKKGAYLESDSPNPISVYGASKWAGDEAILNSAEGDYAILRASWVFSHVGETFPRKIMRRAFATRSLSVVNDQVGCPTPSGDLAALMIDMGLRLIDGDDKAQGLFNYCGDVAMSWFDFADRLIKIAEPIGLGPCQITRIATGTLNLPAKRPANSVLDCGLILRQCGIKPARVDEAIERAARSLAIELSSGA